MDNPEKRLHSLSYPSTSISFLSKPKITNQIWQKISCR